MDRRYPLEALLLSRSYDSSTKINELLEQRYIVNEKPSIILKPSENEAKKRIDLLQEIRRSRDEHKVTKRQHDARKSFKTYLKQTMFQQKLLLGNIRNFEKHNEKEKLDVTKFKRYSKIPHIEEFYKLNELWIGYIQDLLQILSDDGKVRSNVNTTQMVAKLASADFNGCYLRVLKSHNQKILGKHGIVIWDSKNFFIIVEPRDETKHSSFGGLKMIEKKGTVFNFVVPLFEVGSADIDDNDDNYLEFSIIGSRFQFRAADRSVKKFKARTVDDL